MKITHTKLITPAFKLTLLAAILLNASFTYAEDTSGWYTGVSVGQAKSHFDNQAIAEKMASAQFHVNSIDSDRTNTGYKLFGGYDFNNYVSIEGGYFALEQTDFTALVTPTGYLLGQSKFRGLNVDLMGRLPVTERLSAFGSVGLTYAERQDKFFPSEAIYIQNTSRSDKNTNPKLGLGLQYQMNPAWALRFEVERYRLNDAINNKGNMDLVSVGLVYKFGRTASEAHTFVAAPLPVAPPPVAAVINKQEYCSILDIEFEIDKDAIQREEKEKLAVVGTFLTKYPKTTAVIEGHSDNVGDANRNLELSQRRAESVVDYLVANYAIAKSRLTAAGYGETRPIADNTSETGKRHNRRIKAVISCASDIEGLKPVPARVTMAMLIEFDQNKANIASEYHAELAKVGKFLNENPGVTATVEGHAANTTPETSMTVSKLRAQAVVDYLVKNFGIAPARLTAEGFGETRRLAYNSSADGRQENRRVNIILNYPKQ